jgi:asparagine synthetase A
LKVDITKEDGLLFLIDTGADISLLKGNKLIGTTEYDPEKKVKVKCIVGFLMETHGVLEARIELSNSSIVHDFQLVNKQVDIPCDGILGRDFLKTHKGKSLLFIVNCNLERRDT